MSLQSLASGDVKTSNDTATPAAPLLFTALQDDYSDYGDSLENSLEMSDDLIYQSTEMHPDSTLEEPLPLKKIIGRQVDSDEEQEIRLLLATSLHDGASDDGDDCNDSGRAQSPESAVDESVDEAAVLLMQTAIDAALAETYDASGPLKSVKFETPSEASILLSISMSMETPGVHLDVYMAPADGYYSDMDSSSDNELEVEGRGPFLTSAGGGNISASTQSSSNIRFDSGGSNVTIDHEPGKTNHGNVPPARKTRQLVEAEYSDMSSTGSADDVENSDEYVFEHNTPQLRSLELQPLARRVDETLVGGRNQDYLGLAYMYKLQRPYADHYLHPLCVLCHQFRSEHVFFPCEHRCVCQSCLKKERFCEEGSPKLDGYSMCPLCAGSIKRILPHERGAEVAKYWAWVEEISPALPPGFLRAFGHSARVLKNVYIGNGDQVAPEVDGVCKSS